MNDMNRTSAVAVSGPTDFQSLVRFLLAELKPKGKILTPFNIITGAIIAVGLVLIVIRFAFGLASVTNLSQQAPWGIWVGFDVVTGVAFAAGAYVLTFLVYILKIKKYEPIIRATVLNGFLAYVFYAGALMLDLGRPWNVINPIIGNKFGLSSVMFLVAWHFLIYMLCEFLEFSPVVAEWLGWKKLRAVLHGMTTGAVILGITLSTLHQSGLGALFLLAPSKIHPLWYSPYLPVLFFASSVFAGLSMVIIEGTFTEKAFAHRMDPKHGSHDEIILGLGKGAAGAMFCYLFLKAVDLVHGQHWNLLGTPMGTLYLVEIFGFVVAPMIMFATGSNNGNVKLVRTAAFMAALGIMLNRLNVSVIGFNWDSPNRYYPSWMEIEITLAVISMEIWAFRWIVNRMPVLSGGHHD